MRVKGAGQQGYLIYVTKVTEPLPKGSLVEFEGVRSINRITKEPKKARRQFVLTRDVEVGDNICLTLYPSLTPVSVSSEWGTVTQSPRDGAMVFSRNVTAGERDEMARSLDVLLP